MRAVYGERLNGLAFEVSLDDARQAMRATEARLRIGQQEFKRKLKGTETSVTFELDLLQGPGLLQSWLRDKYGRVRGAYFVRVERLSD